MCKFLRVVKPSFDSSRQGRAGGARLRRAPAEPCRSPRRPARGAAAAPSSAAGVTRWTSRTAGPRCSSRRRGRLGAGHRPCALCRRDAYRTYRDALTTTLDRDKPVRAFEINARLNVERLRRGRGLDRGVNRRLWTANSDDLPDGCIVVGESGETGLVRGELTWAFSFDGWKQPRARPTGVTVDVITPPTSVAAVAAWLRAGSAPEHHILTNDAPATGTSARLRPSPLIAEADQSVDRRWLRHRHGTQGQHRTTAG